MSKEDMMNKISFALMVLYAGWEAMNGDGE